MAARIDSRVSVATLIFKKIWRKIYFKRTLVLFAHDLAEGHRQIKVSSRYVIRPFEASDLPACEAHFATQIDAYQSFIQKGYVGFGGFAANTGETAAMVWFADRTFTDEFYGCTIPVATGDVFQMAGEVAEPYRSTPITANLQFAAWDYWKAAGKSRITTLIQDDNAPSMKFSLSAGFKEAGTAYVIHRVLGVRFYQTVHYQGEHFAHHKKENRNAASRASTQPV